MSKLDFIKQLEALGFKPQELADNFISFEYEILVGGFSGRIVSIAFQFDPSFPMAAPSGGPHFSPLLLPKTGGGGTHPYGAIHNSPLGDNWEYWSRPFPNWNTVADKTAKTYMAHIRNLLATVP